MNKHNQNADYAHRARASQTRRLRQYAEQRRVEAAERRRVEASVIRQAREFQPLQEHVPIARVNVDDELARLTIAASQPSQPERHRFTASPICNSGVIREKVAREDTIGMRLFYECRFRVSFEYVFMFPSLECFMSFSCFVLSYSIKLVRLVRVQKA